MQENGDTKKPDDAQIRQSRAEDVAYTINHALVCTASDFIDPFIGDITQRHLGKRYSLGHGGHDHKKHDHKGHDHSHEGHSHGGHLGHWLIGEAVGDFGAVPVTVALTRYAPKFMAGIGKLMEPVFGPAFRNGAKRGARVWADTSGVKADAAQIKAREDELYNYEMRHLPQAVTWTASSVLLNISTQKLIGNDAPFLHLAAGKLLGAGISAAIVVGGRALFPDAAHRWDMYSAKKLFLPATEKISQLFGAEPQAAKTVVAKNEALNQGKWERKMEAGKTERAGAGAAL